jgi:hypothetical protein
MEIRCSKLARPMVCAGYVYLDVEEPEAGEAAKEGTAAGELLQLILERKPIGTQAANGVYFNDDMRFYINPIAEDIQARAATPVLCETRIDWQTASGIWIRGQYDAAFVDEKGRLCIEDLKYGWGIVEVEENWQLLGYAIGEVIRRGQAFSEISLKIHQPRPHHEDGNSREWVLTYSQLLEYKNKIENRMMEIANGRKDFQTSDKCKYCKGAAEACPAFSRLFYRALEVSTEFFQDSLTNEEIARQLDQVKRAEEALKIKMDSLVELGTSRIRKGGIIPGYIQTQKISHREWKPGISRESILVMTGKDIEEKTMMSPAKAEKLGVNKKLIEQLSTTKVVGVKLEKKNGSDLGNKIFGNTNPTGGMNDNAK